MYIFKATSSMQDSAQTGDQYKQCIIPQKHDSGDG